MKTLKGKHALVTGAASGIGRATATALRNEGVHLLLVDLNPEGLDEVADELRSESITVRCRTCDLRDPEHVQATIDWVRDECPTLDILINNAGLSFWGPTVEMTDEQEDRVMGVNLLAPMKLTRGCLPLLLAREESHVVNLCSMAGVTAYVEGAAYCASKFGLVGFTEALALEYPRTGLGVTAVCPGLVQTNFFKNAMSTPNISKGLRSLVIPEKFTKMMSTPEKIANAIVKAMRRRQHVLTPGIPEKFILGFRRLFPRTFRFLTIRFSNSKTSLRVNNLSNLGIELDTNDSASGDSSMVEQSDSTGPSSDG